MLFAIVSLFIIPPDKEYASYIDYRTIVLLFCLMAVVQALVRSSLFDFVGVWVRRSVKTQKMLALFLILLVFLVSMGVTNDVALISFVPFSLMLFATSPRRDTAFLVALETIAANLGAMATPFGNPQNLYLYSHFGISGATFFPLVLPTVVFSLLLLLLFGSLHSFQPATREEHREEIKVDRRIWAYGLLFFFCLAAVLRIIPLSWVFCMVLLVILVLDKRILLTVDYHLLLTFVAFFIFVGNCRRIPALSVFLSTHIAGNEYFWGITASQVISNVPAAILLSGFATDIPSLLLGVDVGGLGTLVASLASLISFKAYTKARKGEGGYYLLVFTLFNLLFLALLIPLSLFFR